MKSELRKDGRIVEIQEDGETIWRASEEINRDRISQESRDKQKTAIKNDNLEKRLENIEEILFGKEIHEGSNK